MGQSTAERSRLYRLRHPERAKAANELWVKNNRQAKNAINKKWRKAHPDKANKRDPVLKAQKAKRYSEKHKEHLRLYHQRRCQERRAWLNELKDHPCVDCGRMYPPECMDFDHVRGDKTKCVGHLFNVNKTRTLDEIAKCDLICSNCHRIRTAKRRLSKTHSVA